ncbi:hypothetical protein [Effusibacillus pohliae]|uniref:hypothetical protein n=1 Tax=Effusibacillus pohliae TaxID=232270 RepID=UPI00035EE592|nr:hypothetical protein [Effusibacillus pohliae]
MGEPIELTNIRIVQDKPPKRLAYISGFEDKPLEFGVHGGVQRFYGYTPETPLPSTLDHIVAAAGG